MSDIADGYAPPYGDTGHRAPPKATHKLVSFVRTSTVHGYWMTHFYGSEVECGERLRMSNFQESMKVQPL